MAVPPNVTYMQRNRRQFLLGSLLLATASTGCLQGEDDEGNGDGGPTTAVTEEPRLDEPPYAIEAQPDDPEAWDELYLCANMFGETDLSFQAVSAPRLTDPLLPTADRRGDEYAVRVLASAEAVHEVFETGEGSGDGGTESPAETDDGTEASGTPGDDGPSGESSEPEEPLAETDFEEHVLLVVESGYPSGSATHHWKRVEATDRGFRLHGCYVLPYERTDDEDSTHSIVRVERPDDFEFARVSLTTGEDERAHFNSTEGVVAVEKDV